MEFRQPNVTLDESTLISPPAEVGEWMADAALRVWFSYDDEGNFVSDVRRGDTGETIYILTDPNEEVTVTFTALDFFKKHVELIWLAGITDFRHDWISFAFRSSGVTADEYDDFTVDAVLQTLLYGKVIMS